MFYRVIIEWPDNGRSGVFSSYPELKVEYVLSAHPANCICIEFDKCGRYFATGSADALMSLWDVNELYCVRTFSRSELPHRRQQQRNSALPTLTLALD